ncbi:MAG: nuclear transport factor 2 family protein [Anaerolineae bacterium]|nr:nuclear transport factor 2 family protein [Anaerolineae bacterium]
MVHDASIPEADRIAVEKAIHDAIGWALTKDLTRLFSIVAQDENFFIFHPDSKSTVVGFEAFQRLGERVWLREEFKATDFAIRDLRLNFAVLGNVAWYACRLDDHAEWDGQPIGWDNCRWTGVLEKRNGQWIIVQMHFSFATDELKPNR